MPSADGKRIAVAMLVYFAIMVWVLGVLTLTPAARPSLRRVPFWVLWLDLNGGAFITQILANISLKESERS